MPRHLLKVSDFSKSECEKVISKAMEIKKLTSEYENAMHRKTLLMLFEKPSLRTRLSFEAGMNQLGGHAIFYSIKDSPLGKKENIHDTAKCASRFVDLIAARVFKRQDVQDLAKHADVPVINMLDDYGHPCQILCDFQTVQEKKGTLEGLKLSFFGDGHNNMTYDLMRMAALFGWTMRVACPQGDAFSPEKEVLEEVKELSNTSGADVAVTNDPKAAAKEADIIYTDSWMSYGTPKEEEATRKETLMPYQVNANLMKLAKSDAMFMNCLPAMRGYEQTAEVIDGPQSVVFDQAENRLHAQKAIMLFLLEKY